MIDVNPAKQGVDNPQRRRTEKRPFESWAQLAAVASRLDACSGALVLFAAATGLRPGEWIALEQRDIDPVARVVYVRRAYRNGRLKCTKTEGSVRAVPLQAIALEALERLPTRADTELLFPSLRDAYFDLHNFRTREWKPAPTRGRDHTAPTCLRSATHLRHLCAACRNLNLRSFPLHGCQPDHDRSPLRASRPQRTRPRDQPPGQL
jgi:integrase